MFTLSEFRSGVDTYRRRLAKRSSVEESRYEYYRIMNEQTISDLSKSTDSEVLGEIVFSLRDLINKFISDDENIYDYIKCEQLSIYLSSRIEISNKCNDFCTFLDLLFENNTVISTGTSSGILTRLKTGDNFSCVAKTGRTFDTLESNYLLHEWFVTATSLNPLRQKIPNFAYVYGITKCSGILLNKDNIKVETLCGYKGDSIFTLMEDIKNSDTLYHHLRYLQKKPSANSLTIKDILSYILQIVCSLQMAYYYSDFTHYDLHSSNVLIQQLDQPIDINYMDISIRTSERVVIIDNAYSHVVYNKEQTKDIHKRYPNSKGLNLFLEKGKYIPIIGNMIHYGSIDNQELGILSQSSYPLYDIFKIFFDIYDLCSLSIRRKLAPLVSWFFIDNPATIGQGHQMDKDAFRTSDLLNGFSLPPFREDLKSYRYDDFIDIIWKNYGEKDGILSSFVKRSGIGGRISYDFDVKQYFENLSLPSYDKLINKDDIQINKFNQLYFLYYTGCTKTYEIDLSDLDVLKKDYEKEKEILKSDIQKLNDYINSEKFRKFPLKNKNIFSLTLEEASDDSFFDAFVHNSLILFIISKNISEMMGIINILEYIARAINESVEHKIKTYQKDGTCSIVHHPSQWCTMIKVPEKLRTFAKEFSIIASQIVTKIREEQRRSTIKPTNHKSFWYSISALISQQHAEYCSCLTELPSIMTS